MPLKESLSKFGYQGTIKVNEPPTIISKSFDHNCQKTHKHLPPRGHTVH